MAGSEEELKNLFMKVKEQSEKAGLKLNIQKLSESEESEVAQLCPTLKRWKCQTTLPASFETCMQVKKQQLEPDMEQRTGSTFGKEYVKAVYCHPAYLTYM